MIENLLLLKKAIDEEIGKNTTSAKFSKNTEEELQKNANILISSLEIAEIEDAIYFIGKLVKKQILDPSISDILVDLDSEFNGIEYEAEKKAIVAVVDQAEKLKTARSSLIAQIKTEFTQQQAAENTDKLDYCTSLNIIICDLEKQSHEVILKELIKLSFTLIDATESTKVIKDFAIAIIDAFYAIQIINNFIKETERDKKLAQQKILVKEQEEEDEDTEEMRQALTASKITYKKEEQKLQKNSLKREREFNLDPGQMSPQEVATINAKYYRRKFGGMYEEDYPTAFWQQNFFKEFKTNEEKNEEHETKKSETSASRTGFGY